MATHSPLLQQSRTDAARSEEARKRLIVALDFPKAEAAMETVRRLDDSCRWFKVGLELFSVAGPAIVEKLVDCGHSVFLDLKFHDIPNTVGGAVRSAAALGRAHDDSARPGRTSHADGGAGRDRAHDQPARAAGGDSLDQHGRRAIEGRGPGSQSCRRSRAAGARGPAGGHPRICLLSARGCGIAIACRAGCGTRRSGNSPRRAPSWAINGAWPLPPRRCGKVQATWSSAGRLPRRQIQRQRHGRFLPKWRPRSETTKPGAMPGLSIESSKLRLTASRRNHTQSTRCRRRPELRAHDPSRA